MSLLRKNVTTMASYHAFKSVNLFVLFPFLDRINRLTCAFD